jgi:hypothetical protein
MRGLRALINQSKTNNYPEITEAFEKHFGFKGNPSLFYKEGVNNEKFKEFIDSLTATNDNIDSYEPQKVLREKLKEIFGNLIYKTNLSENVIDDIIEQAAESRSFLNAMKKIKHMEDNKNFVWMNVERANKGYVYTGKPMGYQEIPQVAKRLLDKDMDIYFANGISYNTMGTLARIQADHLAKLYDDIISLPENNAKAFEEMFNTSDSIVFADKFESVIPGFKDKVFIGSFGDKDSLIGFYTPPKDIEFPKGISRFEFTEIAKEIYAYQYADIMGMNKNGSFSAFKNAIKGFKSLEDFQDKVDNWIQEIGEPIIPIQNIRKREAALVSTTNTFDSVVQPTRTLILEEVVQEAGANDLVQSIKKDLSELNWQEFEEKHWMEEIFKEFHEAGDYGFENGLSYQEVVNKYYNPENPTAHNQIIFDRLKRYVEAVYDTGLEDGTSYISSNLFDLRAKINNIPQGKIFAFKDHYQGISSYTDKETGKVTEQAFLGKTLFNRSDIELTPELEKVLPKTSHPENIVLVGENSHKLKGVYKKFDDEQFVMLNGKPRRVLGYVENTDTSFFKNASSDVIKHANEVSLSSSISVKLPIEYEKEITAEQRKLIEKAKEKYLQSIADYKIGHLSVDDMSAMMRKLSSILEGGIGNMNILKDKTKMFVSEIHRIIRRPMEEGQSKFIYKSDRRIPPDVVVVHQHSPLLKALKKSNKGKGPYYAVGYRYPVPSIYNLGVYEVKSPKDFKYTDFLKVDAKYATKEDIAKAKEQLKDFLQDYSNIGTDHVVPHPSVIYLKIEGDNDGDHFNFVDVNGAFSNIYARAVLNLGKFSDEINQGKTIQDLITESRSRRNGQIPNEYIVTPQVEKGSDNSTKLGRKGAGDLIDSRAIALEAKSKVGVISASIRTLYLFDKMFHDIASKGKESIYYDKRFPIGKDEKKKTIYKTGKQLTDEIFTGKYPVDGLNENFKEQSAMILQLALDFGSSNADQFPSDWMERLMDTVGFNPKYSELITTLSTNYDSFKAETLNDIILGTFTKDNTINYKDLPRAIAERNGLSEKAPLLKRDNNGYNYKIGEAYELYTELGKDKAIQKASEQLENNFDPFIVYGIAKNKYSNELAPLIKILENIKTMSEFKSIDGSVGKFLDKSGKLSDNPLYVGYIAREERPALLKAIAEEYWDKKFKVGNREIKYGDIFKKI